MKKILPELLIAIVVVFAITLYQGRDLVPAATDAPVLEGYAEDGSHVILSSFQRPTLLYFFAPWCTICKLSMGNLNLLRKFSDIDIIIVGLDYEKPGQVFDLLKEKGLSDFQIILGDEKTSDLFKIQAFPTYYTIKGNGKVQSSSVGYSPLPGLLVRSWLATL